MKESYWGYLILIFGILSIGTIYVFQTVTNLNEHNYTLLKETTEAAMIDALDLAEYRKSSRIKIDQEKFVENFVRRFANNVQLSKSYVIEIYDVNEEPPKVSLKVSSSTDSIITGNLINFDIQNKLDAILEEPANKPGQTGSKPTTPLLPTNVVQRLELNQNGAVYESGESDYLRNTGLSLSSTYGTLNKKKNEIIEIYGECIEKVECKSGNNNVGACRIIGDKASGYKLQVEAIEIGTTNIVVKAIGGTCDGIKYATDTIDYHLEVTNEQPSNISLSSYGDSVYKGSGLQIIATPTNCKGLHITSTNPSVATATYATHGDSYKISFGGSNVGTTSFAIRCSGYTDSTTGIKYTDSVAKFELSVTEPVQRWVCKDGGDPIGNLCVRNAFTHSSSGSCQKYKTSGGRTVSCSDATSTLSMSSPNDSTTREFSNGKYKCTGNVTSANFDVGYRYWWTCSSCEEFECEQYGETSTTYSCDGDWKFYDGTYNTPTMRCSKPATRAYN